LSQNYRAIACFGTLFLPEQHMVWKIGCSGYHYTEWKGMFYPEGIPKSKWFEFYCEHFNTIELNVTFYKFPRVESLNGWYGRSPGDFLFSVKAPRLITHFKKFKDAQRYLSDFYNACRDGLREKLGCVLFQFPANFIYDGEKLERILNLLNPTFRNVVEFRHPSWWNEKVFQSLSEHDVAFSGMSHPTLPDGLIQTSKTIYYRLHGIPLLYYSSYQLPALEQLATRIQQADVAEAYIYFNNTAEGSAIMNARQLQEIAELVH
jgi:uncharacterized protein YecE (DUF72 family)